MKYISTTELRTKSSQLIDDLKSGQSVSLIHRSEVVGTIVPSTVEKPAPTLQALQRFLHLATSMQVTSQVEREAKYSDHLKEKYG